ncbi:MAG TPA: divergent polysaccharide deacetylase family protein [Sulfurovum sp.]|uniref:divergent polysaccharide deacetylase family protein n=1 Tax=Sulfurovum sp. TaxID=1969726 RepID=UPI002F9453A1
MAPQTKKTKKSSSQNGPSRRKPRKTVKRSGFKQSIYIVLGVFLMILMVVFGYFLGQHANANGKTSVAKPEVQTQKTQERESSKKILEAPAKREVQKPQTAEAPVTVKKPVPQIKIEEEKVVEKEEPVVIIREKKEEPAVVTLEKKVEAVERRERPKLAIIIDDVSNRSQLKAIQATGLKLTPSIFPPSKLSRTSHRLAEGLRHYMIHLPMESSSAAFNARSKTLLTTFSKEEIEERVKELRALFPRARYINNHTGSVFTDDHDAMQTLYRALRKEGFVFIDSRTIASTKVPQIAEAFGDHYMARDVFIDNEHTIPYIHQQLQKAVEIAKKKGYAIAIGHPHRTTMRALSSAEEIFQDVEIVYIDALYR